MKRTREKKSAKDWVTTWQARRAHTKAELRDKLTAKAFSAAEIESTLAWAKTYAGQSDEQAAARVVQTRREQRFGAARIAAELDKRGVGNAETWVSTTDREELIRAEAALKSTHKGDPHRAAAWLLRRGFAEDIVRRAVENCIGHLEE